ncbi:unnamed protein product, partial [Meganyctiphanes norvegica]
MQNTSHNKENGIQIKIDSLENKAELEKNTKGTTSKTTDPVEDLDKETNGEKYIVDNKTSEELSPGTSKEKLKNVKQNQSKFMLVDTSKFANRKLLGNINKFEKFNESIDSVFLSMESQEKIIEIKKDVKQKESKDLKGKPKNISLKNKSEFFPTKNKIISINKREKESQSVLLKTDTINNVKKECIASENDHLNQESDTTNMAKKPNKIELSKVLFGKPRQVNKELVKTQQRESKDLKGKPKNLSLNYKSDIVSTENKNISINKRQKESRSDLLKIDLVNNEIKECMASGNNHLNKENDTANVAEKPKKTALSKVLFGKPRQVSKELDKTKIKESNDFLIPESQENKADNVFSPKHKKSNRLPNKMIIVNSSSLVKKFSDTKRDIENQTSTPIRDFGAENDNGQNIMKRLCEKGVSVIKPKVLIKEIKNKNADNTDEILNFNKNTQKQGNIDLNNRKKSLVSLKIDLEDTLDDIVANLSFNESQGFEMDKNISNNKLITNFNDDHACDSDMFDNSSGTVVNELQYQRNVENCLMENHKISIVSKKEDLSLIDTLNYENDSNKIKNEHTNTTSQRYSHDWNTLDSQDFIDISMENNLKEYEVLEKTNGSNVIHEHVHSISEMDSDGCLETLNGVENNKRFAELVNTEAIGEFSKVDNGSGVLWDTMDSADFAYLSAESENQSETSASDPDLNGNRRAKKLREKVIQEFSDISSECFNLEDIEKELDNETDVTAGSDIIEFVGKYSIESKHGSNRTSLHKKVKDKSNVRKQSINNKVRTVGLSRPRSNSKSSKRKRSTIFNESFKRHKLDCSNVDDRNMNKCDSPNMRGMETPLYEACSEELDFGVDLTKSEGNLNSDSKKIKGAELLNNGTYICPRKDSGMFEETKNQTSDMLVLHDLNSVSDLNKNVSLLEGNNVSENESRHSRAPVSQQKSASDKTENNDNLNQENEAENGNETISDSFLEEAFESYFEMPTQDNRSSIQKIVPGNHIHDLIVDKKQHLSIAENSKVDKKPCNELATEKTTTDIGELANNFTFGNTFACISQWNVTEALSEEKNHKVQIIQGDESLFCGNKDISEKKSVEKNKINPKPEGSNLIKKPVSKERLSHDLFAMTPSPEPRKLELLKPKEIVKVKDQNRLNKTSEEVKNRVNMTETFTGTEENNASNIAERNLEVNENSFNMSDSFQCSSDTLYIIDVVGNGQLFKTFIEEWSHQTVFSMSLACEKKPTQTKQGEGIGWRIGNGVRSSRRSHKTKEEEVAGVVVENTELLIVGIAICWGHEVYYINLRTMQEGPISCTLPTPPLSDNVPFEERVEKVKQVLEKLCIIGKCTVRMWDVKTSVRLLAAS